MLPKVFVNGFKNIIFINLFVNTNKYFWKYSIENREIVTISLSHYKFQKYIKINSKFHEIDNRYLEFII